MNKPSFPLNTARSNVRFRLSGSAGEGPRLRRPPAALAQRAAGTPPLRPGPREGRFPGAKHLEQIPGVGVAGPGPVLAAVARPGPAARRPGAAGAAPAAPRRPAQLRGDGSGYLLTKYSRTEDPPLAPVLGDGNF